jgi:hypothetical protein
MPDRSSEPGRPYPASVPEPSAAADLIDALAPPELQWVRLVRSYPIASLILAAVGGFYLGRTKGTDVVESVAQFAAESIEDGVNELLGERVL